jgi:glutathione S-transferase
MGVHSPEEVSQFGCTDLKVLSDTLADKPFFFGDEPTTVSVFNPLTYFLVVIEKLLAS